MRALGALAALLLVLDVSPAAAGRRRFAWVLDPELVPQRGVELEWWIEERILGERDVGELAVHGVIGLTDNLELALPLETYWDQDGLYLQGYGAELRWRLAPADPARAGPVIPLLRAGVRRLTSPGALGLTAGVAVAVDASARLRIALDAGVGWRTGDERAYLVYSGGATFALTGDLFAGVEAYGVLDTDDPDTAWIAAGPVLSFTHGRFWITGSLPIGLVASAPDLLARVVWATAF